MLKRHPLNPILTRESIPASCPELTDVSAVFNPGAILAGDTVHLLLRVQNRGRETILLHAHSKDGVGFIVDPDPIYFEGIEGIPETIFHIYDPRITRLNGRFYIVVAMDMESGCRLGLAVTDDFKSYEFLGIISHDDNRNGVLFPEMVNGKYLRADRPNRPLQTGNPTSGDEIWLSSSIDLKDWIPVGPVLRGRNHYWDELVGAGPPPVKTEAGWLLLYHGIAPHFSSSNIYQVGAALLDLDDPSRLIARTRFNILEPRELYEMVGQVPNVVFPGGMVVWDMDEDGFAKSDSRVSIHYGAADTVIGLAETTIGELIDGCRTGTAG
ncbi:MAG TPA: glycosidase [Bacteroidetes bacterium]|nr:beta-1,4-mannooligosaccharide phosphorylase [bacterium BMS3Bbin04]HDO64785.1 glycosidase [Bacteroidota bacterium]HEX03910.1 glycosidase [Bacteroidota bacterium]